MRNNGITSNQPRRSSEEVVETTYALLESIKKINIDMLPFTSMGARARNKDIISNARYSNCGNSRKYLRNH